MGKTRNARKKPQKAKPATPSGGPDRKPRILWANTYCLLDLSSGASMAVNEMLLQLAKKGFDVQVIGATIFDSENGVTRFAEHWDTVQRTATDVVNVTIGPLVHRLVKTESTKRLEMTSREENIWHTLYRQVLEEVRPDLVFYYGGQTLDLLIPDEAEARGIPSVAYVGNANYKGTRWCRDVDLILTDSHATARMYRDEVGFFPEPVGAFIDPAPIVANTHERRNILLVNPSPDKGAAVVIALAMLLEKRRPDITFEVVESRGDWHTLVEKVTERLGERRTELQNITITPNTNDMRPVYGRARVLLALSLCRESFGRVAVEAMMNGIPAIVTNRGGLPEAVGDGGVKANFPQDCYEPPYNQIPSYNTLEAIIQYIERYYDDPVFYQYFVDRAREQASYHRLDVNTQRLLRAITPLVEQRAGDKHLNNRPNKQLVRR